MLKKANLSLIVSSIALVILLAGCSIGTMKTKPPRPNLDIKQGTQGGICLDGENTSKLLHYIRRLEKGYK